MNKVIELLSSEISGWVSSNIKVDLIRTNFECTMRGLNNSATWATELLQALPDDLVDIVDVNKSSTCELFSELSSEYAIYSLAKNYMTREEYDRAAHFTKNSKSPVSYFLHIYCRYLAGEKRRLDNSADPSACADSQDEQHLKLLCSELQLKHKAEHLDGFALYLYGVVLKKLDLIKDAISILVESVNSNPLHWEAWKELSLLVTDKDMLLELSLPNHWIRAFFYAQTCIELQLHDEALKFYNILAEAVFKNSNYILAQKAIIYHNTRSVTLAVEAFDSLYSVDPYRLENMDIYSNLLYVKGMRAELAKLAHRCSEIDKYKVETCCIIGNYYSLRGEHEKAVLYFQRALKLNPNYLSAWTLMGHEYMELKHTAAAIFAYRQAVEVNKRDYRAWYGLGQTYEILKMPYYCLYYYKQAQMLRPNDSRMVVAMGDAFEKLERLQEAKKCFYKAHSIGDMEGVALVKLAKLYEKLSEEEQAASAYTEYINECANSGVLENCEEQAHAFKYLANYHMKHNNKEEALYAAQKCTDFSETREEGKALITQITRMQDVNPEKQPVDAAAHNISNQADDEDSIKRNISPIYFSYTP